MKKLTYCATLLRGCLCADLNTHETSPCNMLGVTTRNVLSSRVNARIRVSGWKHLDSLPVGQATAGILRKFPSFGCVFFVVGYFPDFFYCLIPFRYWCGWAFFQLFSVTFFLEIKMFWTNPACNTCTPQSLADVQEPQGINTFGVVLVSLVLVR